MSQLLPKPAPADPGGRPVQVPLDDVDARMAVWADRGYRLVNHQVSIVTLGYDPGTYFAYSFVWARAESSAPVA